MHLSYLFSNSNLKILPSNDWKKCCCCCACCPTPSQHVHVVEVSLWTWKFIIIAPYPAVLDLVNTSEEWWGQSLDAKCHLSIHVIHLFLCQLAVEPLLLSECHQTIIYGLQDMMLSQCYLSVWTTILEHQWLIWTIMQVDIKVYTPLWKCLT